MVLLCLLAITTWRRDSERAENSYQVMKDVFALGGEEYDEPMEEPNRAGPLTMGAIAAVLFLGGTVLVAASPPTKSKSPPDGEADIYD